VPILRIDASETVPGTLRVIVSTAAVDGVVFVAANTFPSPWTPQHAERLEWLRTALPEMIDDIQQFPSNPGPQMSLKVGRQLLTAGVELFRRIFEFSPEAQVVWYEVKDELYRTDVEIMSTARMSIPWEILRDPKTGKVLAETVRNFRVTQALPPQKDGAVDGNGAHPK